MNRRVKLARLRTEAYIEDIDYRHPRELDRGVMQDLITSRWVHARRNVIITGASGPWLANALSHNACRDGFSVEYKRVPRLVEELNLARADGTYLKLLAGLARTDLLVLDDWGLAPLTGQTQHSALEIIDDRAGLRSTLLTSQLPVEHWHDTMRDPSVADALLDRALSASTSQPLLRERSIPLHHTTYPLGSRAMVVMRQVSTRPRVAHRGMLHILVWRRGSSRGRQCFLESVVLRSHRRG